MRRSGSGDLRAAWKSIHHRLLITLPVGPTGSAFSCWDPATKHLAFIFNHTSLSADSVGRRQTERPHLFSLRQTPTDNPAKAHSCNTLTYASPTRLLLAKKEKKKKFSALEVPQTLWWDVAPLLLSPKSVLSQQVAVLSCEIPFFLRVFWFKAQLKQTEANPLSSQQLQAGYQLRVIMMSHSSGVCVWTSNMTLVCSGHLFCGTQGETQPAESRTRTFGDKESACFGEFSLRFARTFVSTCAGKRCQRPSGQSLSSDALQRVLSGAVPRNLYLTLEEIIIQRSLVQFWDSGQLKPEMLLKEAWGH